MPVRKKPSLKKETPLEEIIGNPEEPSFASSDDKASEGQGKSKQENPAPVVMPVQPTEPSFSRNESEDRGYEPTPVPTHAVSGILDIQPEGHGFLRPKFIPSHRDIYISQSQIRRFMLRPGDLVEGVGRPPKDTERYFGLLKVEKVNGREADASLS